MLYYITVMCACENAEVKLIQYMYMYLILVNYLCNSKYLIIL